MTSVLHHADTRKLRFDIDWHLEHLKDDAVLLPRLEGLAEHPKFGALSWHWAPRLYRRDPARLRPFVLRHFADIAQWPEPQGWQHELLPWQGEVAQELEPWFTEIDQADDVPLFRKLYAWRHRKPGGWGLDEHAWRRDLLARFTQAATKARRAMVLEKFDLRQTLDEPTAQGLYAHDPALAAGFILKKLPSLQAAGQAVPLWTALMQQARSRDDGVFRQQVYRRMVPGDVWERDALALCRILDDPAELNAALELHHPDSRRHDLGEGFTRLMQARGLDVLPYVRAHLRDVLSYWGRKGYSLLDQLAATRGWVDFRIALVMTCGRPQAYNAALAEVLDGSLDPVERLRRLTLLCGVSQAWQATGWGLARAHPLDEALALRLYGHHPDLVRTLFKAQITPTWRETHAELFERAWAAGDTEITDHLASRYATRGAWSDAKHPGASDPVVDRVAERLAGLKLPEADFARRAAGILTRLPAGSIRNYQALLHNNRLARLLFQPAPEAFLAHPASVSDLVEAAEIHVQGLGYRVLALPDPRARALAHEHLDVLAGALLRPLKREARMQALRALDHAGTDAASAQRVLAAARQAFALPDAHYPKEALVGLVGRLAARHPPLAGPEGRRLVHRRMPGRRQPA